MDYNTFKNLEQFVKNHDELHGFENLEQFKNLSVIKSNIYRWYEFEKDATILELNSTTGITTNYLSSICKKVISYVTDENEYKINKLINRNNKNVKVYNKQFLNDKIDLKFDYIIINDFNKKDSNEILEKCKNILKENGKILLTVTNRFGLASWCGSKDFDEIEQINLYNEIYFTYNELNKLFKNNNFKFNYYYALPNYKFANYILTDEYLKMNKECDYTPIYFEKLYTYINETTIFKAIVENNQLSVFANSYFIELSKEKTKKNILFVKFNDYRNDNYNLYTYFKDNKYYKKNYAESSKKFLKKYYDNYLELSNKKNINIVEVKKDESGYFSDICKYQTLFKKIDNYIKNNDINSIVLTFEEYYEFLKQNLITKETDVTNNCFEKYNIIVPSDKLRKMHFIEDGYIDIIPQNIFIKNNNYCLMDQEWKMVGAPIEYVMWRALNITLKYKLGDELLEKIYEHFGINDMIEYFHQLETKFVASIENCDGKYMSELATINIISIKQLCNQLVRNKEDIDILTQQYNQLKKEYDIVVNSKGWRFLEKIRKIIRK